VSLTSFLKIKDVRERFAKEFKKPKIKLNWKIKAPPLTTHYTQVSTAFDYLMRFYLKYANPDAEEGIWRFLKKLFVNYT